jgi:hypothetical protein
MTTTAHPAAGRATPLALLLRTLAIAVLLAGAGSDALAVNVSITSIQPVANEASLTPGVVQFNRDSSSGPLVIQFTLSGAAATTNSPTLPTFTTASSAALALPPYATSGTITLPDGSAFAQLVITPLDNSAITGDLPLVVTVSPDRLNGIYSVVQAAESAQVDIAEGDYQASVVVPAPVAYENTALVGNALDPNAPRRGVLRVSFFPIPYFPGATTAPGLSQLYLLHTSGAPPGVGAALTINPTSAGGSFTTTATAAFGAVPGDSFISFSPAISVGIPIGSTVSSGAFSGTIALVPPAAPTYDKALKVQFGGSAALPSTPTGSAAATTDTYYVTYKIGGSGLGSATNQQSPTLGWRALGAPGVATLPGATAVNLGQGGTLTPGSSFYFNGDSSHLYTYSGMANYSTPGPLNFTPALATTIRDGDSVTAVGNSDFLGVVSEPIEPGTTSLVIENGVGTFAPGDVFTLAGEVASTCRYVVTSTAPSSDPPPGTDTLIINFRRYTAGTIGIDGVNNLHSANAAGSVPLPALITVLNVSDDAPYNGTLNLAATGGIVQLLVPAESALVDFGINPIDNGIALGRQSVTMALFSDLNYATVTPTAGQVIIAEADSTAGITPTGNAVQGATPATTTIGGFVIALTNPFSQAITVPFTINGSGPGVGQPGIDYTLSSTSSLAVDNGIYSVIIPANATSATISVTPLPTAALGTSGKTVTLTLSPSYDYLTSSSGPLDDSATISLLPAPPPTPQLSVTAIDALQPTAPGGLETVGSFTITALVPPVGNLIVQYALSGTAAPGTDYITPNGFTLSSGTGLATILAGTSSVTVPIDPNMNPLPAYKWPDQAIMTLLPAGTYILPAAATSTATLNIDQSRIVVDEISSTTANGTYGQGATILVNVIFSAPVTVAGGIPTLTLNASNGVTNAVASYTSGSGTTTLVFTYVVGPGDVSARLDCSSSTALSAAGATIAPASNPSQYTLSLALPPPATTGSLYSNSDLVIDGAPTVAIDPTQHVNPSEFGLAAGHFVVTCSAKQINALTVFYTLGGNAVVGTDIAAPSGASGQLVIPAGQTSVQLAITPLDNPVLNTDETVALTLIAGPGYHLVSPATATAATTDQLIVAQDRIGVVGVTSNTPNGIYHYGAAIILAVNFSAPVAVTGIPQLTLNTGAVDEVANYASGSGSSTLLFTYTVAYDDASAHLEYLGTTALGLHGGTILDANMSTLPVYLTLAAPAAPGSLSASSALVIDGTPAIAIDPTQNVNPQENLTAPGHFVVTANPAPTSDLVVTYTIGGTAVIGTDITPPPAPFTVGTLTGTLTIPHGAAQADLVITPIDNPVLNTGETVAMTLVAGSGYHLVSPTTATAALTDTLMVAQGQIGVLGVTTSTPNGTYQIGAAITLAVNFSAAVAVTGTPQLALNTGTTDAVASYTSGSGTSTLTFTYVVGVGDASAQLDYLATSALSLNGGTILDANMNTLPVQLTLAAPGSPGSLSASSALVIDGSPAIAIDPTQHVAPIELNQVPGQFVVTCTPAPTVDVTVSYAIGGSAVIGTDIDAPTSASTPASFTTGTLSGQLIIRHGTTSAILTITPIDNTAVFNLSETVSMTLVAGTGYHLAPTPAVTTDTLTVVQDHIAVTSVSALPTSGTFNLGSQLTITVTFSEAVAVGGSGTPTLALNSGSTAIATLASGAASGSGSATLNFTYVIGAGDASPHLDYLAANALQLNGAVLSDPSGDGLAVYTALSAPGTHGSLAANTALVIDGSAPVVTAVSATSPNGTYTYGQSLTLTVTFSLPVNVSGTPELQLATGATPAEATYAGGNGTTTLDFTYVVGAGDASADLDCTGPGALTLNGGSISWTGPGAAPASLALPVPGAAGSLGVNKALVINGALPTGKPPVGSISGPDAGTGGGCGLGSGIAGLAAALALCLRAATLRRQGRDPR